MANLAGLGTVFGGISEGLMKGMMARREQERWDKQQKLQEEQMKMHKQRAFFDMATKALEITPDESLDKWLEHYNGMAEEYEFPKLNSVRRAAKGQYQFFTEGNKAFRGNLATGDFEELPVTLPTKPQYNTFQEGSENVTYEVGQDGMRHEVSRGPKWDTDKQGMNVTLPDGTIISSGGSRGQLDTGLQKTTQNEVEKQLLSATSGLKDTMAIKSSFDPKYATYGGQARGVFSQFKAKLSGGEALGPEEQEYLNGFVQYRAEAGQRFTQALKDLSGVAVNPTEFKRAEAFLINPGTGIFDGDDPATVQSKMERLIEFQNRAVARLNYIRRHGMSIQNVPLEKMDQIIKARLEELTKQMGDVEQAKQTVAAEFGLVY